MSFLYLSPMVCSFCKCVSFTPRLCIGFIVWLLLIVPVAPSRIIHEGRTIGPLLIYKKATKRQRGGQSPTEMAVGSVEKDVWDKRHHAFMVCPAQGGFDEFNWIINPYSSICFARQCGCTILWLNSTATQWRRSYMLTYSWAHDQMVAGQPILFLPRRVWHNRIFSNRSCNTVNPLISAVLW